MTESVVKDAVKAACESHTDFSTLPDGTRQQILEAIMGDNGFIILTFLKHIRDHGPDADMEKLDAVEYVSPSDSQDIGWVFTTRAFLNHLINRLGAT